MNQTISGMHFVEIIRFNGHLCFSLLYTVLCYLCVIYFEKKQDMGEKEVLKAAEPRQHQPVNQDLLAEDQTAETCQARPGRRRGPHISLPSKTW